MTGWSPNEICQNWASRECKGYSESSNLSSLEMKLWVFACRYLRNIQIGYDTRLWAVSVLDKRTSNNRWAKAQKNLSAFPWDNLLFDRSNVYDAACDTGLTNDTPAWDQSA
jgi:hypothetical protein